MGKGKGQANKNDNFCVDRDLRWNNMSFKKALIGEKENGKVGRVGGGKMVFFILFLI